MHADFADPGEEMARVRGAVVVSRSDLTQTPNLLSPVKKLYFAKTLQSYSPISKGSIFPR